MRKLMLVSLMAGATAFATPVLADDHDDFIEELQGYLALSEQFVDLANRSDAAVFFAVEGIVEIHEERGEEAAAIPILREALDKYPENQAVRNLIRFKLRDLYRETGQADLALAELQTLIEENR